MKLVDTQRIADGIQKEVFAQNGSKKTTVKALLKRFGYKQRREEYSVMITELLGERDVLINPPILKINGNWVLTSDDRIYLSRNSANKTTTKDEIVLPEDWNIDGWFDSIASKNFRTEREVETKFIIPLLSKLGFLEDDRYDAMIVNAAQGSRQITLEVDFALFDSTSRILQNQTLIVAEAKKEFRLMKKVELENAQRQVKSYSLWLSCHFGLITDGQKIQVLDLIPSFDGLKVLFECERSELKASFFELYKTISKTRLVAYYQKKFIE